MNASNLEKQLTDAGYAQLFLYSDQTSAAQIWQNGSNKELLEQVISSSTSGYAVFLAAELLRQHQVPLQRGTWDLLAEAYAHALQNTGADNSYQLNGNMWGFLYPLDDPGYLGQQLIQFGEAAIPHLVSLLNDDHMIYYDGSQEATMGNNLQYRVKDFAAFYISKIRNIPLAFYQDHADRDREIERLKTLL